MTQMIIAYKNNEKVYSVGVGDWAYRIQIEETPTPSPYIKTGFVEVQTPQCHRGENKMITQQNMELLRKWIKAEIVAGIADPEQDAGGYYFTGYEARKIADRLFKEICGALENKDNQTNSQQN